MTRGEILSRMDANEFLEWAAYYKSNDEDFRKETLKQIDLEKQKTQSKAEEARRVRELFQSLTNGHSRHK